jgi:hypothetical protein
VNNYLVRVTSGVYVKEDGAWKLRSDHYSAILGGGGTTQTLFQCDRSMGPSPGVTLRSGLSTGTHIGGIDCELPEID